jgi:hypothetical protein
LSEGTDSGRLAGVMEQSHATTYSSGIGGRAPVGAAPEFEDADIDAGWSRHRAITGDSILTLLMDFDDPMELVLNEHHVIEEIRA